MSVYAVTCKWFDEDLEDTIKPTTYYFFDSAEDALDFIDDINWDKETYIKCGEPMDVHLYKLEKHQAFNENSWLDQRYIAAWWDVNKYTSSRFRFVL